jgi:hypothetical protein
MESILNLTSVELIRHTQNLIDTGDYGPMLVNTLQRLLDVAVIEERGIDREEEIDRLEALLNQIIDIAQDK